MNRLCHFSPSTHLDARDNMKEFIELVQNSLIPLGLDRNKFSDHAWNMSGLGAKGGSHKFIYFVRTGFDTRKNSPRRGEPAIIPEDFLLRSPFLNFAKALLAYLHGWKGTTAIPTRLIALRFLEAALCEVTGHVCPTMTTPEVMAHAQSKAAGEMGAHASYNVSLHLSLIYRSMAELGVLAAPSTWRNAALSPSQHRNRVGKQFDADREKRLPSPQVLDALAEIFNSDTNNPTEIFASSICALMLCAPDRSVEALYAPLDIFGSDWTDPITGEVGTGLRWFPAKGGPPLVKTVIPSMRGVAYRAVERLRLLSAPARDLANWYEKNPRSLFLPPELEYLRGQERLSRNEVHSILYGSRSEKLSNIQGSRAINWLTAHGVRRESDYCGTTVAFADLESAIIDGLPPGFPIMDPSTGMRYSEALCIMRSSEFDSKIDGPSICSFGRVKYVSLQTSLKSNGFNKSIFEKRGFRDAAGEFLSLSSHMLRHYLNTLVRQSGTLTEEDIAKWSGRKNVRQNSTYNHLSDRDVLAKLRVSVGDPSLASGPFANIDKRVFIRREEFASIKIITAHTSEFGFCIHDYAQTPCQVYADCINCSEQVCVKGDQRAEANLRKLYAETVTLHEKAIADFHKDILVSAEWFQHQTKTLSRVTELLAILDDPLVPVGAIIQLDDVISPSRLAMIAEVRMMVTNI